MNGCPAPIIAAARLATAVVLTALLVSQFGAPAFGARLVFSGSNGKDRIRANGAPNNFLPLTAGKRS